MADADQRADSLGWHEAHPLLVVSADDAMLVSNEAT